MKPTTHRSAFLAASLAVRLVSAPVITSIVKMSDVPLAQQRSTAILVPSGDHVGLASIAEFAVRGCSPVPSAFIT